MSELVAKVSTMLRERRDAANLRRQTALVTYAEGVVAEHAASEAAEGLVAAMDELGLDADDLTADARAVEAARRIERQLADADRLLRESMEALAAAEREKHEVQGSGRSSFDLNAAHAKVAEAENLRLDRQQHFRELQQQLQAATVGAPRIFAGQMRRLAVQRHVDPARGLAGSALAETLNAEL